MVDFSPLFVFSVCGLAASVTALIVVLAKGGANRRKPVLVIMLLLLIAIFVTLSLPLVDIVSKVSSGEGVDSGAPK